MTSANAKLIIERIRPGEELALYEIYHSAIHMIARRDYTRIQIDTWAPPEPVHARWVERIRGINPFVAKIDGKLVGYGDVQLSGYIDHFFVSGQHPRQGIGKALMQLLIAQAQSMCLNEMTSDVSRTAQPFFENFGFKVVEYKQPIIRGVEVPNAFMRKVL